MPPEPLPWDRKDFFREKKHNNGGYDRGSEPLGGSGARWRDTQSHGSRNDFGRWGFPSDFRRPPGHGKQGGWHMYPEDISHGYTMARSGDRFFQEGGGFRPSGPHRDGRYSRNFRESRVSLNQRDWRGNLWDYNHHHDAPSNGPGRFYDVKDQKPVDGAPARLSRPQMDVANTSNLVHSEEHGDESSDVSKAGTCQRVEKEGHLASDWKPFKWSRPGNMTTKGSAPSFSGSPKVASPQIASESCDVKIELPLKISTPDESFSGDALGCLASPTCLDDTSSRKKPRLGWGEGLAKYEKKKGPYDSETKSPSGLCTSNIESVHSPTQNWVHESPRIVGSFECRSPTTPSSFAYSSSPGLDDKSYTRAEIDSNGNKVSLSPTPRAQNHSEAVPLNLENMEINSFCNLNELLTELIQKEERDSLDSGLTKVALNTLLSWKGDISRVLELTESEIDSLENELKSLKSRPGSNSPAKKSSSSLMSVECKEKLSVELNIQRSHSLPAVSSGNVTMGGMTSYGNLVEETLAKTKDECMDSPATSKFTEFLSTDKTSSSNQLKHGQSMDVVLFEEAFTSVKIQNRAGPSGPDCETKVTNDAIVAGHDNVSVCDNVENNALDYILVCNKETATKASKLLDNLLPSSSCVFESIEANRSTTSQNNLLMENFLKRKHSLGVKERVLSMKYKAFRYMWKDDLQLLSEKKHRTKSQKKVESSARSLHSGFHRNSIRSHVTSTACHWSSFPTPEVVSFTSKLLSDHQMKCYRRDMMMPALILDEKEKVLSRFPSNNGLVQDPCAVERERPLINPWTAEEKDIFLDKYATLGKNFTKISSFLDHKTTADCIEFYYKNHKSDCFKKAKKQQELKKQQTSAPTMRYLMTSEKKWSKEMNAASLDMLGAASVVVARDDNAMKSAKILSISGSDRKLRGKGLREMSSSYNIEDERETEAADVLAGICGSLSSEAMSSCITSSADPGEGMQDWKSWKSGPEPSGTRFPPTAEVTQNVDDTYSDESCGYVEPVDWTDEERSSFVQAFSTYGKDFLMISRCVSTKSRDQCRVFFSKVRKCLGLESILCDDPRLDDEEIQIADDPEGGSDTEDACVVQNELAITCGDKLSVGTDEDTPMPTSSINHDDNGMNLHDKVDLSDECAPVRLDENELIGRSKDQDCLREDMPDDGAVLNKDSENVPIASNCVGDPINGLDTVMSEAKTDLSKTGASVSVQQYNNVADIAVEELEAEMSRSLDSHDLCSIPYSNGCGKDELFKRATSVGGIHQSIHSQTYPELSDSRPMGNGSTKIKMQMGSRIAGHVQPCPLPFVSRTEPSVQPLQVYLKKCQRSASVQPSKSGTHHQQHLLESSEKAPSSCRNVKLFGQILSKSAAVDKSDSENHVNSSSSSGCEGSSSLEILTVNNGSSGLENFACRSYGFWEGNRIQTGSSIPDSTVLVAKYPGIFGSTSEGQLSELTVKTKKSSLTCGNYYQQVNPIEQEKMQAKQQQEVQRNGFEAVPGVQQIELNVVESEARACLLSDPVAALKLHYANSQHHGGGM